MNTKIDQEIVDLEAELKDMDEYLTALQGNLEYCQRAGEADNAEELELDIIAASRLKADIAARLAQVS